MKRPIISVISKLTLGVALVAVSLATQAQAPGNPTDKNAEVKYLGTSEDAVLFNIAYDNPAGYKFSVAVLDQDGNQIFQDVYNDKKFDKRFKLPRTATDKVTFVIRNYKDADIKQSFEINTRVTEDVVVTKVR